MKREQFLKALRKEARKAGLEIRVEFRAGKGSHAKVWLEKERTIVKSGELSPQYVKLVRKQLGLK